MKTSCGHLKIVVTVKFVPRMAVDAAYYVPIIMGFYGHTLCMLIIMWCFVVDFVIVSH